MLALESFRGLVKGACRETLTGRWADLSQALKVTPPKKDFDDLWWPSLNEKTSFPQEITRDTRSYFSLLGVQVKGLQGRSLLCAMLSIVGKGDSHGEAKIYAFSGLSGRDARTRAEALRKLREPGADHFWHGPRPGDTGSRIGLERPHQLDDFRGKLDQTLQDWINALKATGGINGLFAQP